MAFEYKTLHPVAAALPPAEDRYCPECGQSLTTLVRAAIDKPSSRPWCWVVLAVGIYLVVASGLRAWNDEKLVAHSQLRGSIAGPINAEDGYPAKQLLPYAVEQLDRDLVVGGGGLVLVLVGLGSVARQRLKRHHQTHIGAARMLLGVWGPAETLVVSLFSTLLLVFGYLLVSELIAGEILTRALTDETVSRTVDVILYTVDVVAAGKPGF